MNRKQIIVMWVMIITLVLVIEHYSRENFDFAMIVAWFVPIVAVGVVLIIWLKGKKLVNEEPKNKP